VVDKDGYVAFINELSNNAFTSLQYNAELNEWGQFPVKNFNDFPSVIKKEFYTHACGGPFVICENAFLYTDGTGSDGASSLNPQQEVYLFQVCKGIEEAIKESKPVATSPPTTPMVTAKPTFPPPPTYTPTTVPPPTLKPVEPTFTGNLPLQLTYHAMVSSAISTEELQLANSTTRSQLLGAMRTWSYNTARNDFNNDSSQNGQKRVRGLRQRGGGGRELLVVPTPMLEVNGQEYMDPIDVECSPEILNDTTQDGDHCIQITTNLTLQLTDEPLGTQNETLMHFTDQFGDDLQDGTFYNLILPVDTRMEIRAVYPVPAVVETLPKGNVGDSSATIPTPTPTSWLVGFNQQNRGNNDDTKEPSSSVAGIVSGVCVGLLVAGMGFFLYRRRQSYKDDFSKDGSGSYTKKRDFDPANDLEGGAVGRNNKGSGSQYSSRDEFSSGESQSSSSMQSYSGSESDSTSSSGSRSSRSSRSSYSGSRSGTSRSYTSRSSYASSTGQDGGEAGPVSVSASESGSYSGSSHTSSYQNKDDDPNSPVGNDSGVQRNVVDAATLGRASQSLGSESEHSNSGHSNSGHSNNSNTGSLYSIKEHDSSGSSVGVASDPANMNLEGSVGSRSRGSRSTASASRSTRDSSEGYRANVDLMDQDSNQGSNQGSNHGKSNGTSATPTEDDSSAGSSGWDSEDGDSSVDTGSVDSYDPNTIRSGDLGSSVLSSEDGDSTLDQDQLAGMVNPAVNPVVQRGVTMLPIDEVQREDDIDSTLISDGTGSTSDIGGRRDQSPMGGDIQEAIEKGDWAAVGATAAILASDSSGASSVEEGDNETRDSSGGGAVSIASTTDEDDMRAAEIDQLVENGNWDGVVAVAARYADEAEEADDQLGRPLSTHVEVGSKSSGSKSTVSGVWTNDSVRSDGSGGSVSVETADASSAHSNTTGDSMSHSTFSVDTSMDESKSEGASTISGTTPPDTSTMGSSITSSYVSGGLTQSMVSAVSSDDQQEKRQMNAYRAEVEALVRRVVPDEIDNVDDIMVQFSGREEELIETLRAMQEKSIAQRARAAVQRSAKKEAGRTGRDTMHDESSEDLGQSMTTDGGQSMTTDGGQSATTDGQTRSGSERGDSTTEQFTEADDYSTSSGSSGNGTMSSYSSGLSDSRSGVTGSEYSESQYGESQFSGSTGVIGGDGIVRASPGISDAIDASDWHAVGAAAKHLGGDGVLSSQPSGTTRMSKDTRDGLDGLIDEGNWTGIIDAASNMTSGHVRGDSSSSVDDDLD